MANNVGRYLQNSRLNWLRATAHPAVPAALGVALLTTLPTDNNGTGLVEVANAGSYARVSLTPAAGLFTAPSTSGSLQQMSNVAAITFVTATANWGTIVGVAIYDSATYGAGNLLYFAPLAANQVVNNGNTFSFLAGALVIQED